MIEVIKVETIILETADLSHLIIFEIKTCFHETEKGIVRDGEIKETIYQMREF